MVMMAGLGFRELQSVPWVEMSKRWREGEMIAGRKGGGKQA